MVHWFWQRLRQNVLNFYRFSASLNSSTLGSANIPLFSFNLSVAHFRFAPNVSSRSPNPIMLSIACPRARTGFQTSSYHCTSSPATDENNGD
ncbi:hypothetical protein GCK72_022765 [Caenorhabditis remanei]|uniref:Uncharacterized protein n=1 Tax=Caenorhabditis remanei TaxID=31234 RepID=A0A6A5FUT7_CAERE|nr:hypothetical protein GCK72_022765 [Caenorhabditis remanei]KAF1746312.1 hypothetical protein GCK72_022765 [Caenorhabditis remanei]